MDAELERHLREMIDRQAIWQVMLNYARGLDRMDVELVRSCYFDDAIEDHGRFVGSPDDFIAWANEASSVFVSCLHTLSNHNCELDGDDAHCETYYIYTGIAAQAPHFMSTGRYIDHFQRRNGEWRIANRVISVESNLELQEAAFAALLPPAYGPGEVEPSRRDRDDASYQRPVRPRQPKTI